MASGTTALNVSSSVQFSNNFLDFNNSFSCIWCVHVCMGGVRACMRVPVCNRNKEKDRCIIYNVMYMPLAYVHMHTL